MGQDCAIDGRHRFYGATLRPGPDSAKLAAKLAQTADYGTHSGGWLARRLFALDDDVEITGEIAKASGCIGHAKDDDLEFAVILSPESRKKLSQYFSPPDKTPTVIWVEMVASLLKGPFRTWRNGSIEFAIGDERFRPIQAQGSDWIALKSPEWKYVSARGALVVDMGGGPPGSGGLEIHPAERIRLMRKR